MPNLGKRRGRVPAPAAKALGKTADAVRQPAPPSTTAVRIAQNRPAVPAAAGRDTVPPVPELEDFAHADAMLRTPDGETAARPAAGEASVSARANGRRAFLAGLAAAAAGTLPLRGATAAQATPRTRDGPFYPAPAMRLADVDNDLLAVAGAAGRAAGDALTLKGRIADRNGDPVAGARIEIWQCDANGRYLHPGDRRDIARDRGFQGFGHDIADDGGRYRFRTIVPVPYPGRTPHIHVKVLERGRELLTTQFYLADHPQNPRDFLFRRMTEEQALAVSMRLVDPGGGAEATVDIVV